MNVSDKGYSRNVSDKGYSRNVSDKGYSRNASYSLNLISIFVLPTDDHAPIFSPLMVKFRGKRKRTNRQTTIYKTLHRKRKIEQHEPH